jgi:hypothetical protein
LNSGSQGQIQKFGVQKFPTYLTSGARSCGRNSTSLARDVL